MTYRTHRCPISSLFSAALLLAALLPASASAEALMEIYRLAESADTRLQAAEFAYQSALEGRPQALSGLRPQINASAAIQRQRQDIVGSESAFSEEVASYANSGALTLTLVQSLYNREISAGVRQADASIEQATAELEAERQSLLFRVAQAYLNILAAEDQLEFARAESAALGRQLEQAQRRFEVGLIAITDVAEAQSSFDAATAQEIATENDLDSAREALAVITGQYFTELAELSERMELVRPDPEEMSQWVETALQQNLSLVAAAASTEVAREQLERQRAGRYPTVNLQATHTYSDRSGGHNLSDIESHDSVLGIQLQYDLYTGGRVSSAIRQAQRDLERSRSNLAGLRREVTQQTRDAYRGVLSGISQVKALQQAVVSAETALEATEAGYEVGTRTSVDVLVATREVFRAKSSYAQARYSYLLDTLALKQASGILEEADLERINNWLDS